MAKRGGESPKARIILQYDLDGNFIKQFNSIGEACDAVGLASHSGIIGCCQEKPGARQTKGFMWKYYIENYPLKIDPVRKLGAIFKEKYGIDSNNHKDLLDKIKNTNLIKYGEEHPMQNAEIKEALKRTSQRIYGTDNPAQNKIVIKKISETESFTKTNNLLDNYIELELIKNQNGILTFKHLTCNHTFEINRQLLTLRKKNNNNICTICNTTDSNQRSEIEIYLSNKLRDTFNLNIENNIKGLVKSRHEIDILLKDYSIGIEVNGIRYHNDMNGRGNNYHLDKTKMFGDIGITILHFFDDEILEKEDLILSMIGNKIGMLKNKYFARKCDIRIVSREDTLIFLNNNHLQGFTNSKVNIGLYLDNKLISLMTFGSLRKSLGREAEEGSWELLRFCNLKNIRVVGSASKLFAYFIKTYNPNKILTYANRRWSNGEVYKHMGFKLDGYSDPGYWYFYKNKRVHRYALRKSNLVAMGYDSNKTEEEITAELEIPKIYDCGNIRFIWNKE